MVESPFILPITLWLFLRASNFFSSLKSIKIVILRVYYFDPFGLSFFSHCLGITLKNFNFILHFIWIRWWFNSRNAHSVHVVYSILFIFFRVIFFLFSSGIFVWRCHSLPVLFSYKVTRIRIPRITLMTRQWPHACKYSVYLGNPENEQKFKTGINL